MTENTHPRITIEMDNGSKIICELYPEYAPNTVRSFLSLIRKGCYDNHAIERIAPGFVADMSFTAFGKEDAKYLIPYETKSVGFPNELPADPGAIVMGGYENGIAGGEFFFPFCVNERIRWNYPAFGKVILGMDEIMRWNELPVHKYTVPQDPSVTVTVPDVPPVIRTITAETFGIDYPEPYILNGEPRPSNWG